MDTKLLLIFIILNIMNVVIQTIKSLCTINCGKLVAAIANAVAYGLYTVVVIYMVCELPLWLKVVVVGSCNFVGVYAVKWFEEKMRKDKLWKVEATFPDEVKDKVEALADGLQIPYNTIKVKGYIIFNFYCSTQKDSHAVRELLNGYKVKYFVSESKAL